MRGATLPRRTLARMRRAVRSAPSSEGSPRAKATPIEKGARLHLGSGRVYLDGWVNIDDNPARNPDVCHDLRLGLPAEPGTVSLIYTEHVFEHFSLEDGQRLMAECRRVLAPGGIMRVAMPDLAAVVERYRNDWREQEWLRDPAYSNIDSAAHMLNFAMRAWGHCYLYDAPELRLRLTQAGFVDIQPRPWGESPTPELRGLERRPDSKLVMEASAPR